MVNATPDSRLRIHPWHRPIPRRPGEVQFGLLPEGPIVTGLTSAEVAQLARLDGSRSLFACFREAAASGIDPARWRELIDLLINLGIVESLPERGTTLRSTLGSAPGSVTTSRYGRSFGVTGSAGLVRSPGLPDVMRPVVIDGFGPLAEQLVTLLGRDLPVHAWSTPSTVPSRGPMSAGASRSAVTVDHVTAAPSLVVLVGAPALDPRAGDRWLASGIAHLPVSAAGRRTTIGPLVEGPGGPCLWCLDLHRADRDEAWPTVMAQLCPADAPKLSSAETPGGLDLLAVAELHLTAGSVAAFAQSVLAGHRPPTGISIDICLPWPRMDHRRWAVHPRCLRHDDRTGADDGRQSDDGHRVDEAGAVA